MIIMSKGKNKIVVQTANVLVEEKNKAEAYARSQGFDSLQAALRFVIRKMAEEEIHFNVHDNYVSDEVERQIGESLEDIKHGRIYKYEGDLNALLEKV